MLAVAACGGSGTGTDDHASTLASVTDRASSLVLACTGCHSDTSGAIASLDDYDRDQLRDTLMQYKTDESGTTVMHRLARGYSDADIDLISAQLGLDEAAP